MSKTNDIDEILLKRLYDDYRTALFNRKYYGNRLATAQKFNKSIEIILAIGTSSTIAGWPIFKNQIGIMFWAIVGGISVVLSILKPIINIPRHIERYSRLFVGHGDIFYDLYKIVFEVQTHKSFSKEMEKIYDDVLTRIRNLATQDDPKPSKKLLNKFYVEVNKEIPSETLWTPKSKE